MQRRFMVALGQAEDHHGDDQRVVGAEQTFERDEQGDGDEVGRLNHGVADAGRLWGMTPIRSSGLTAGKPGSHPSQDQSLTSMDHGKLP